jgi:hypothetical protein
MSYREFAERVKSDVLQRWRLVRGPKDDARPCLYFYRGHTLHRQLIPFAWFSSREDKDELVARTAMLAGLPDVTRVAQAWVMWEARLPKPLDALTDAEREAVDRNELPEGWSQPSDSPDRVEVVQVSVYDPERHEVWRAELTRRPRRPPRLGAFAMPTIPDSATGLMVDPIKAALR